MEVLESNFVGYIEVIQHLIRVRSFPKRFGVWAEHIVSIDQLGNFSCLQDVRDVNDLKLVKYNVNKIFKTSSHFLKKYLTELIQFYDKNELRIPKRQILNTPIPK